MAAERMDLRRYAPLLVVLAAALAYSNSLAGPFIFDDRAGIVENLGIRSLWRPWAVFGGNTRPFFYLTLAINYAIGGLSAWDYHAVNVAIHIAAALTLFGLVRRTLLTERLRARYAHSAVWLALAVSLIWAVHPLQTESVTYIFRRADALLGMFFFLALYCFVRGVDSPASRQPAKLAEQERRRKWKVEHGSVISCGLLSTLCRQPRRFAWHSAAVGSCALGMASHEVMAIAPVVILLYDRTFAAGSFREALRRRWGLHAGAMATWIILIVLLAAFGGYHTGAGVGFSSTFITPVEYALTQPGVILKYIGLSFWPHPLCLDYWWPVARSAVAIVPALVVVAALLGATGWALVRRPAWGFLGAWFFLILGPTSSIMPMPDPAVEHRMYLPLAAVVALVVIGGHEVLGRLLSSREGGERLRGGVGGVLVALMSVTLGLLTYERNENYRSEIAIWLDVVAKRPENPRAYACLGRALLEEGRAEEAVAFLNRSLRIYPHGSRRRNTLGLALRAQGKLKAAAEQFREALRVSPRYVEARANLGLTLAKLGRFDEAAAHCTMALRPDKPDTYVNMGLVLGAWGKPDEAVRYLREAVRIDPVNAAAHFNLASALAASGRKNEALVHYEEAVRLNPSMGDPEMARKLRTKGR